MEQRGQAAWQTDAAPRKVVNVWWAYARREVQLRYRPSMVKARLQDSKWVSFWCNGVSVAACMRHCDGIALLAWPRNGWAS